MRATSFYKSNYSVNYMLVSLFMGTLMHITNTLADCHYSALSTLTTTENISTYAFLKTATKNPWLTWWKWHRSLKMRLLLQLVLEFPGPPYYLSPWGTHGNYLVMGLDWCVEHNWLHRGWLAQNINGSSVTNEEGCELVSSCCHAVNANPHDTATEVEMMALITPYHPISDW